MKKHDFLDRLDYSLLNYLDDFLPKTSHQEYFFSLFKKNNTMFKLLNNFFFLSFFRETTLGVYICSFLGMIVFTFTLVDIDKILVVYLTAGLLG